MYYNNVKFLAFNIYVTKTCKISFTATKEIYIIFNDEIFTNMWVNAL